MIKKIMYQTIQFCKRKGLTKSEIVKETGLDFKTVRKYYRMSEQDFRKYLASTQHRTRAFEPFKKDILEVYKANGDRKLPMAAVYDYLEEIHGTLPCSERTFRNYIEYLVVSEQLKFKTCERIYTPVPELPFGKQMQLDFGQYKTRSGMRIYILAAVLSASRYKFIVLQDRPFTTLDLIGHLLDCFTFFGGIPKELVIDQDRLMVVSENSGDIIYTKDFSCFVEEMGLKMYVCRKADPESKGKVENLVKFVKGNFFKVRDFASIAEAQERLFKWLGRRANGKISSATMRIPAEIIEEERKHLRPIRVSIFQKNRSECRESRTVNKGLVSVGASKYQVPPNYRRHEIEIFRTREKLFLFDPVTGRQIAEYTLSQTSGETVPFKGSGQERAIKLKDLKEKLLSLVKITGWREFVTANYARYTRYFRDQYHVFMKSIAGDIQPVHLEAAVQFCLENGTFSMTELRDTYHHFCREAEPGPEINPALFLPVESHINPELRNLQVAKRDLAVYAAILESGRETHL